MSEEKEERRYCPVESCLAELNQYDARGRDEKIMGKRYQCPQCGLSVGHNYTLSLLEKKSKEHGQGLLGFGSDEPRGAA